MRGHRVQDDGTVRLCGGDGQAPTGQVDVVEVQHRIGEALAAHTEVRFVDDPRSVIQPDSRVRDHGVLVTLAPVPPAGRPVRIGARSYSGNLGSKRCTFVVDGAGAQWQVTGTTGIYAVS